MTFGMPPRHEPDEDRPWRWAVQLLRSDSPSILRFYDIEGVAKADFHGTPEGAYKALELVNYLVGSECRQGILAGTQM